MIEFTLIAVVIKFNIAQTCIWNSQQTKKYLKANPMMLAGEILLLAGKLYSHQG